MATGYSQEHILIKNKTKQKQATTKKRKPQIKTLSFIMSKKNAVNTIKFHFGSLDWLGMISFYISRTLIVHYWEKIFFCHQSCYFWNYILYAMYFEKDIA